MSDQHFTRAGRDGSVRCIYCEFFIRGNRVKGNKMAIRIAKGQHLKSCEKYQATLKKTDTVNA